MTAEQAGEIVAQFIDASYPNDKNKIYTILELAMSKAWKEGKWLGMTKEFFTCIERDANGNPFINSPKGFSALLGINLDCKPRTFRDNHFMFHKNGFGDIKDHKGSCNWNEDVYDNGIQPTEIDFKKRFPRGAILSARSIQNTEEGEVLYIGGKARDSRIISFEEKNNIYFPSCGCVSIDDPDEARSVMGVELPIRSHFSYVSNVVFDEIEFIKKSISKGFIEVIAVCPDTGYAERISYLAPWETESKYHRYLLPQTNQETVHCLFKIEDQQKIVADNQPLIINEKEAIISLAIGIYLMYYKESIEKGSAYILQGINVLEKQKREEESHDVFPIEVIGKSADDVPDIFKYY